MALARSGAKVERDWRGCVQHVLAELAGVGLPVSTEMDAEGSSRKRGGLRQVHLRRLEDGARWQWETFVAGLRRIDSGSRLPPPGSAPPTTMTRSGPRMSSNAR